MKWVAQCLVIFLVGSSATWAQGPVEPCQELSWTPNTVYRVKSQLHVATHIMLPEPMQGKPVAGNATLWAVSGENVHLFIKPKTAEVEEGQATSVSVISVNNESFDFLIERVTKKPDVCIKIVKDDGHAFGNTQGWSTPQQRHDQELADQLQQAQQQITALRTAQEKARAGQQAQVLKTLAEYRTKIYTGYVWDGGNEHFGKNIVSDVYDDGRFTFIRVTHDNKGILQLRTRIAGKEEMIEYDYDEAKKLYTVAGIYPELLLSYDETTIEVHRKNTNTWGGY